MWVLILDREFVGFMVSFWLDFVAGRLLVFIRCGFAMLFAWRVLRVVV